MMISVKDNSDLFFKDLNHYNRTNFKTLYEADISVEDAITHKAFSSVVTRFFIFAEKHPELTLQDMRMLYFKLKIDMIAKYFSEYPASSFDDLRPFQSELRQYVNEHKQLDSGTNEEEQNE